MGSLQARQALTAVDFGVLDQIVELELKWSELHLPGELFKLARNHRELHHQLFTEVRIVGQLRLAITPVLPVIPRWQRPLLQGHGDLLKRRQAVSLQPQKVSVDSGQKRGVDAFDLLSVQWARNRRWINVHWGSPALDSLDIAPDGLI